MCIAFPHALQYIEAPDDEESATLLGAALSALSQLTSLYLSSAPMHAGVLAAAASLPHLQRCCISPGPRSPLQNRSLPAGPWASSLRLLAAPYGMLLLSGDLLRAASQMDEVCLLCNPSAPC